MIDKMEMYLISKVQLETNHNEKQDDQMVRYRQDANK